MSGNGWLRMIADNPGHSAWYIERFRTMAADGVDLDGEARFIDAIAPRHARILDAGCGPGRVGGRLTRLGHTVVGVDIDPELIAAARVEHPETAWLVADLATVDLPAEGITEPFDIIVCVGNVMTFLDPATRVDVLAGFARHLTPDGRIVVGFGADRGYHFDDFTADARTAGLETSIRLASWDLQPLSPTSSFLVAVVCAAGDNIQMPNAALSRRSSFGPVRQDPRWSSSAPSRSR